jgi:hypothetical protein
MTMHALWQARVTAELNRVTPERDELRDTVDKQDKELVSFPYLVWTSIFSPDFIMHSLCIWQVTWYAS